MISMDIVIAIVKHLLLTTDPVCVLYAAAKYIQLSALRSASIAST